MGGRKGGKEERNEVETEGGRGVKEGGMGKREGRRKGGK